MLKIILLATFLNCLTWTAIIPLWQYPDEQAHFGQVQYFANFGYSPYAPTSHNTSLEIAITEKILGTERNEIGDNKYTYNPDQKITYSTNFDGYFEAFISSLGVDEQKKLVKHESTSNPPLYYFGGALVHSLLRDEDIFARVFAVRLLSSLLFVCNIFVIFQISKIIFANNTYLKQALPLGLAFTPMFVFSSTGVLTDPLTNLLFSLILFGSLQVVSNGLSPKIIFGLLTTIFLGLITRQQFAISILIVTLALICRYKKMAIKILFLSILAIIFVFYFLTVYTASIPILSEFRIPDPDVINFRNVSVQSLNQYFGSIIPTYYNQTFPWYWGVYKWLSLTLPIDYYRLLKVVIAIAMIGLFFWYRVASIHKQIRIQRKNVLFLTGSATIYFLIFLLGDYLFFVNRGYSFGIQGRYFFPMISVHFVLIILGLSHFAKLVKISSDKVFLFLLAALLITLNNLSLFHVASSYYEMSDINLFMVQASQYKPEIIKGINIFFPIIGLLALQICLLLKILWPSAKAKIIANGIRI